MRKLLIAVLALGTVGGYAWGFRSMGCHRHHAQERREAFERHVAQVCVDAAREAASREAPQGPRPSVQGGQGAGVR
jgi:hypothetical protein